MSRMRRMPAVLVFCLCAAVYFIAPVRHVMDSHYSMLLGESLWRHGSFSLDRYFASPARHWPGGATGTNLTYHVYRHGGHVYYAYPPGSSVLSIPLVLAANAAGVTASHPRHGYDPAGERRIEALAAPVVTALAVTLLYLAAARLLDRRRAAVVALAAAFATGLLSTASRVMWSHTWGVCLLSAAILLLVQAETGGRGRPVLLATILSWLYFTRPTFSVSIAAVTLYVLLKRRRDFPALALAGAAWLAAFVVFSLVTSGTLLPPYYLLGGTLELAHFRAGLAGTLLSPSRGLLVYSPAVLIPVWLVLRNARGLPHMGLAVTAAIAAVLHLASLAAWSIWAAGFCYGARYAVDFMPWLALLAALGWRAALDASRRDTFARAAAMAALAVSLGMQTIGAFSDAAWRWNIEPDVVDQDSPRLWSWRDAPYVRPFAKAETPPPGS